MRNVRIPVLLPRFPQVNTRGETEPAGIFR